MKLIAYTAAGLLLPLLGIAAVAGGATGGPAAATAAAAVACVYANPDADRVAVAMEQLTELPVDQEHWDTYRDDTDLADVAYESSTAADRHELLADAVRHILNTEPNATITTPIMIWWTGTMPAGDTDTAWHQQPVPGWDGNLESYLAAFANTYAVDPVVLDSLDPNQTCIPNTGAVCGQPLEIQAALATIRQLESGNRYDEQHRSKFAGGPAGSGHPTGAYQYLWSSWNQYGGYNEAFQAPPNVQDARAIEDINSIIANFGDVEWVPIAWYVGQGGANKIKNGDWPRTYIPNPDYNSISIGDYQTRWMDQYTLQLTRTGVTPVDCPAGGAAAVAWGETQIGAKYAAVSPYRFGTPSWPGGSRCARDTCWTYDVGTTVFDCSGFVISAWQQAGIDFTTQHIYSSQDFLTNNIPDADRNALQPGDIAVYRPDSEGIGHVVLVHDITNGIVHTIESSASKGVHIGVINWTRVSAIKRPAAPTA